MEYLNPTFMLLMAAALCAITALIHSVLGEHRLIGPILASGMPLMESPLARNVTRFAWHWTTVLWFCVAAVLVLAAYGDIDAPWLILGIGIAHLVAGVADAVMTRGQHMGWPLITLIGVLATLAYYVTTSTITT
ncbi:hypothetical protein [Aurantiacibacter sediminis]|uniref:DUF4267 domain-containing protein n=1 Tax=Aurantiacibacter sediminis TaxID=2793064 RepID=A0ABS0N3J3_9SPHN|nr:hypothetical protein [Aurantiacibacter sediminis]MBH5322522.1 hypothetical protein [Aurantiacibacter sediminis]